MSESKFYAKKFGGFTNYSYLCKDYIVNCL